MRRSIPYVVLAILFGAVLGVGSYAFVYAKGYSYLQNSPSACANCHVMNEQYSGWIASSHHTAATCNDCHTPHNVIGKYAVKATNGFFHSLHFTLGDYPDVIQITNLDRRVTESACRYCHANITQDIDAGNVHGKAESIHCTRCHLSVGHSESAARVEFPELPRSKP